MRYKDFNSANKKLLKLLYTSTEHEKGTRDDFIEVE